MAKQEEPIKLLVCKICGEVLCPECAKEELAKNTLRASTQAGEETAAGLGAENDQLACASCLALHKALDPPKARLAELEEDTEK
jgi:hypothetical protein